MGWVGRQDLPCEQAIVILEKTEAEVGPVAAASG